MTTLFRNIMESIKIRYNIENGNECLTLIGKKELPRMLFRIYMGEIKSSLYVIAEIVLCRLFLIVNILSGCGKQESNIDLVKIDVSDINKVEHTGTTGGQNDGYSYSLSESERNDFIDLLNHVKIGNVVAEKDTLSSGAFSCYVLYYTDGKTLTISSGRYFKVKGIYYEFKN